MDEKGKKIANFPKFYGKVPVGTKGQIVIPAEARKTMGISPGDSLIIISGPPHQQKMMSIVPEEEFNKFLSFFEEHLSKLKTAVAK
jgi:AbrB family looped-hinge helix DNA binding protein